jgi:hypothetical protein
VITLHAVAGLFALYMLFRHVPGARALLRREAGRRPMAIVSAVNVLLALAILAVAARGLVGALLRR